MKQITEIVQETVTNHTGIMQTYYDASGQPHDLRPGESAVISRKRVSTSDLSPSDKGELSQVAKLKDALNKSVEAMDAMNKQISELTAQLEESRQEVRKLMMVNQTLRKEKKAATK